MFAKTVATIARTLPNTLMGVATILIAYGMAAGVGQMGMVI